MFIGLFFSPNMEVCVCGIAQGGGSTESEISWSSNGQSGKMKEVGHDGERQELLTAKQLMVSPVLENRIFPQGFFPNRGNVTSSHLGLISHLVKENRNYKLI